MSKDDLIQALNNIGYSAKNEGSYVDCYYGDKLACTIYKERVSANFEVLDGVSYKMIGQLTHVVKKYLGKLEHKAVIDW